MLISIWVVFACMMADVMPRGHGGDGAGDSPPRDGFGRGAHEQDLVPRKKTRGKGKNFGLDKELRKSEGKPLSVPFDECTYHSVGKPCDYFTREVGIYIWRNIALDREGWRKVAEQDRNALDVHLRGKFDLAQVEKDIHASKIKGGIKQVIQKRFSDRKNKAKVEFRNAGGYADVERARSKVPEDMSYQNWQKAINHFLTQSISNGRQLTQLAARNRDTFTEGERLLMLVSLF